MKRHSIKLILLVLLASLLGIFIGAGLTEPPLTRALVEVDTLAEPPRQGGTSRWAPLGSGAGRYTTGFV